MDGANVLLSPFGIILVVIINTTAFDQSYDPIT